jgi:hypothetical protein
MKLMIAVVAAAVVVIAATVLMVGMFAAKKPPAGAVGTIRLQDCVQIDGSVSDNICQVGTVKLAIIN